eukprot:Em0005g1629a
MVESVGPTPILTEIRLLAVSLLAFADFMCCVELVKLLSSPAESGMTKCQVDSGISYFNCKPVGEVEPCRMPEVLPQTVFCDPQVVLTKVTQMMEYHHKLRDSPDKGVAAELNLMYLTIIKPNQGCIPSGLFCCLVAGPITLEVVSRVLKYQGVHFKVVSETKWKYSIQGQQRGDLCEGQLMWLVSQDKIPVQQFLCPWIMDKVAAVIPHKYEMVGLQLRLSLAELQVIGPRHPTLEEHHRAFGEMFGVWRRRGSPPYTWRTLNDVLRSASVGEVLLSDQLISWITQHYQYK